VGIAGASTSQSQQHRAGRLKPGASWWSLALTAGLLLAACSGQVNGLPEPRIVDGASAETGRALIAGYGCGSCHNIPGVPGADAMAAPPLDRFYERSFIAGHLANNEANLIRWIQDPQAIDPGTAMPNLGVSQEEARHIAAYLYHQSNTGGWFNR
jgi:cytochrome c